MVFDITLHSKELKYNCTRRWRVINARRLIGARLIDYVIINNLHNGRRIGVDFEQKIGHFVIGYRQFTHKLLIMFKASVLNCIFLFLNICICFCIFR